MAITLGKSLVATRQHVIGNRRQVVIDGTLDSTYPTGGYSLTPQQLGVGDEFDFVSATDSVGHTYGFDYSANKLKVFSGSSEVTLSTDLHTVVCRIVAQGKGSPKF